MSALDNVDDFKFRVRKYPDGDLRSGHELHIEVTVNGEKIGSRSIISADIPPDESALDYLIQRAAHSLRQAMREGRDAEDKLRGAKPGDDLT